MKLAEKYKEISTLFFNRPTFLSGASKILDIGSTFYNNRVDIFDEDVDYIAVKSDWAIVGSDIKKSFVNNWAVIER